MVYESLEDVLEAARDNGDASRELAARGPGYVMVAETREVAGGFELQAVTVHPELGWNTTSKRHVVKTVDGRKCPVCGRTGAETGQWATAAAAGSLMTGLDPVNCIGCHDTYTTHGRVPREFAPDGSSVEITRPE